VTRLGFGPAGTGGPIVAQFIDIKIKLRAFLFVNIDEVVSITYDDYRFVGD
jgi:hypothetical protein